MVFECSFAVSFLDIIGGDGSFKVEDLVGINFGRLASDLYLVVVV